jgi:plasmid maintenance system antidote protein VapI
MTGFGERLSEAMRKKGIEQKKMAEILQIPQPSLSRIVNGKQYLDFDLAVRACELLGISLEWLAYGRESMTEPNKKTYHRNPDRQRIEYLLSIMNERQYPAIIVALEGIIEVWVEEEKEGANPSSKMGERISLIG